MGAPSMNLRLEAARASAAPKRYLLRFVQRMSRSPAARVFDRRERVFLSDDALLEIPVRTLREETFDADRA